MILLRCFNCCILFGALKSCPGTLAHLVLTIWGVEKLSRHMSTYKFIKPWHEWGPRGYIFYVCRCTRRIFYFELTLMWFCHITWSAYYNRELYLEELVRNFHNGEDLDSKALMSLVRPKAVIYNRPKSKIQLVSLRICNLIFNGLLILRCGVGKLTIRE